MGSDQHAIDMNLTASPHRRAFAGVLDQALSSVSNFAVIVFVARNSGLESFGAFTLTYLLYGLALGILRAVGGEILLLASGPSRERGQKHNRDLLGLSVEFGIATGVLLGAIAVAVPSMLGASMSAMAIVLPIVLWQDACRYIVIARQQPGQAIVMDALWLAVQVAAFAVLTLTGLEHDVAAAIFGWAAGAAVAGLYGASRIRLLPRWGATRRWLRVHRARVKAFLADFLLLTGTLYLSVYAVGAVAGLAVVAAFRGAYLLFAPFDSFLSGARLFTLPALANACANGQARVTQVARQIALYTSVPAAVWGVLAISLPSNVGTAILGATWTAVEPVAPGIAIVYLGRTIALPAIDGLRAIGAGRLLVILRILTGSLSLVAVVAGATVDGARGAAYALAVTYVLTTALWWGGLSRASRFDDIDARGGGRGAVAGPSAP